MARAVSPWGIALAATLWALDVRWTFATFLHPPSRHLVTDMGIYLDRGRAMVSSPRSAWDTFTPPGYPAFIAVLDRAFPGDADAIGGAQAVLGALTVGLSVLFAFRLDRSRATAAITGAALAVYFPLVLYTGFVLTETLFAFLLLGGTLAATESLRRGARAHAVVAGLAFGLAVLVRPSLLLAAPFLASAVLGRRARVRRAGRWITATAGATLLPAILANSIALGRPASVATNGGVNFYLAWQDCRSVRTTAEGPIREISTFYTRAHHERACERPEPFYEEGPYYRAGLAALSSDPARVGRGFDAVREGLGVAPRRAFPDQPFWPGSVVDDDAIDTFSRGFAPFVAAPAFVHWVVLRWRARRGARRERGAVARRVAGALLFGVLVALFLYNGNPRVRVSADPLAVALAASAWVALGRGVAKRVATARRRATGLSA